MNTRKLRKRILAEAICGNLTADWRANNPVTQTGADLLAEIRKTANGKKPLAPITDDEKPFEIPDTWTWCRLGEIGNVLYGVSESAKEKGEFKLLRITDIQNDSVNWNTVPFTNFTNDATQYILRRGDILFARTGGTIGKSYLVENCPKNAIYASYLIRLRFDGIGINSNYIKAFFNSLFYWRQIIEQQNGSGQPNCNGTKLASLVFPLPPLSEQEEIVKRIEQAFAEIDKIEAAQTEIERLCRKINKQLLQQAICGNLTADWRANNPVTQTGADLLAEIKSKASNKKPLAPITDDEKPFKIPDTWTWCRLGEIGIWGAGATPSKSNSAYYQNGTIPWLLTGDLTDEYVYDVPNKITQLAYDKTSVKLNPTGSVLIAMYGATIGKLGILTFPATTNQACCACQLYESISNKYLFYYLKAQRQHFIKKGEGGAQPNISKEKIVESVFPLPPQTEQEEIVRRIEGVLGELEKVK